MSATLAQRRTGLFTSRVVRGRKKKQAQKPYFATEGTTQPQDDLEETVVVEANPLPTKQGSDLLDFATETVVAGNDADNVIALKSLLVEMGNQMKSLQNSLNQQKREAQASKLTQAFQLWLTNSLREKNQTLTKQLADQEEAASQAQKQQALPPMPSPLEQRGGAPPLSPAIGGPMMPHAMFPPGFPPMPFHPFMLHHPFPPPGFNPFMSQPILAPPRPASPMPTLSVPTPVNAPAPRVRFQGPEEQRTAASDVLTPLPSQAQGGAQYKAPMPQSRSRFSLQKSVSQAAVVTQNAAAAAPVVRLVVNGKTYRVSQPGVPTVSSKQARTVISNPSRRNVNVLPKRGSPTQTHDETEEEIIPDPEAERRRVAEEQKRRERESYEAYIASLAPPPPELPPIESNIAVCVRCRPLSKREFDEHHVDVVRCHTGQAMSVMLREVSGACDDVLAAKRVMNKDFEFDRVYGGINCSNRDVFDGVVAAVVDAVVQGDNGTVFAYGATGSGKTFTMLGTPEQPGVTVLAMMRLFERLGALSNTVVKASFLEIYCERVRDLLAPPVLGDDGEIKEAKTLDVREGKDGVQVPGLTSVVVASAQEVLDKIHQGNKTRTVRSTNSNSESSRSHALFQVHITRQYRTGPRTCSLSMIDLAGSERLKKSEVSGMGQLEATRINQSLLSLGNCITKLATGSKDHIPFRDSKLTRLLQESLQGQCKTAMIANVSPSHKLVDETMNTLKYAERAKSIKTVTTHAN